ncbi:MAG: patatin-like phospholipase family protein [Proteiniphilum sp.]
MKKILFITLFLLCYGTFIIKGQEEVSSELPRKKVGVVLSGGGAKGFAHVGVLKILEEVGIPIDYIAGTSMGAVVGGLYAVGYSAGMIDSLIQIQDWNHLMRDNVYRKDVPASQLNNQGRYVVSLPYNLPFGDKSGGVTLPPGVFTGQNIYTLLLNSTIGYQENISFDNLPIPFGCISADVRTGEEIAMRKGNLAEAIRASMAIPGMFTPVEKEGMLLIDGGVINNYPVDLVRSMGADIVIGVIFSPDEKELAQSRGSISEITQQIWNFIGQEKRSSNIEDTDILITPDVYPYGMLDFQRPAIDTIIMRGMVAATKSRDKLIALKKSLDMDDDTPAPAARFNPYLELDTLIINKVFVEGITPRERGYLNRWVDIENERVTRTELDEIIAKIYGSGMFNRVYYRLEGKNPFDLILNVEVKESNRLNLGIHFDSNDMAAILANTKIRFNSSLNSMFDITTRLSRDPYLIIDYSINRGIFYEGGIKYKISRNDLSIYDRGELLYNLGLTRNSLRLVFSEFYFGNMMLHLGAEMEHFHFYKTFGSIIEPPLSVMKDQLYFNYMLNGVYDNLNKVYFPTSGQYFSFQYSLHTDNFVKLEEDAPLSVLKMNFLKPVRTNENIFITPRITARYLMNDSVPHMYRNLVGGRTDEHYMPQQISLQGSPGMEFLGNVVLSADVTFHYNFTPNNYLYTNLNFTIHNNRLHTLFKGKSFPGINLGYSFLTVAGPLQLELGYSGLSRRFHPYVSYGYYF